MSDSSIGTGVSLSGASLSGSPLSGSPLSGSPLSGGGQVGASVTGGGQVGAKPATAQTGPNQPSAHGSGTSWLAVRLGLAAFAFCIVYSLFSIGVRTWLAWEDNKAKLAVELAQLDEVFQRPITKAIWEMDRDTLAMQVQSIGRLASVGQVALTMNASDGPPEVLTHMQDGWSTSARVPTLERDLVYEPYPGERKTVGRLRLAGDERVLWARLRGDFVAIAVAQVLQSLLLAGFIMWLFNRSVTVHVRRVAHHLQRLAPDTLSLPLQINRSVRDDELDVLVTGVNQLQRSLAEHLERQRRDEGELASHRDRLADLVLHRTTALQAANAQLEALARIDPLTGLQNRRCFDESKLVAFRRARLEVQPLSVLLCDVDHFKRYNDTYGHAAGDACLKQIGQAFTSCFGRSQDVVARIGGEEFAVLLPGLNAVEASATARRLLDAVAALCIEHEASDDVSGLVTLSIGVAGFDSGMDHFDVLFLKADQALYKAKRAGRNRIVA